MDVSSSSCNPPWFDLSSDSFYTDLESEYDKFIADATRLAQDVSGNQTFYTVKPLLNFWAAFTPSKEVRDFPLYRLITLKANTALYRVVLESVESLKSMRRLFIHPLGSDHS
jgi:hypothetical protein